MAKYFLKRLISMVPVLMGVSLFIFMILHFAPGDPARIMLGEYAGQADVDRLRIELGLNQPLIIQYLNYMGGVVQGDFGMSYMSRAPVFDALVSRYPATLLLAGLSTLVMVLIGLPIGIISATKQYSLMDRVSTMIGLIGVSMPTFWIGMLLVLLFSLNLRWLPAAGFAGPKFWILPSFAIGFNAAAICMRMTRSSLLEVIRSDFIRTSRAKGQTEGKILMHHALKNSLIPIITVVGLQLGMLLGGAMVTEAVFSIPGLGSYMLTAILSRDYPVVQGGVILIAATFSLVNLLVDFLYAFVDPRIKAQYKSKPKVKARKEIVA